jgi:hypothetical protein
MMTQTTLVGFWEKGELFGIWESPERGLHRYCLRCKRRLKRQKWMEIGYGCVCYRKINDKD